LTISSCHGAAADLILRSLEKPIIHRYKEIEEFPHALNNSQMWNWSTRLFITEARDNLTIEEQGGAPAKYTNAEVDSLEKALKEHEAWLGEWVAKQKVLALNDDPVILTSEMRARAKTLENHLQKLWKKKVPKKKPASSSTSSTESTTPTDADSASASEPLQSPVEPLRDEL
jgi:hypoxia up-regulated 1